MNKKTFSYKDYTRDLIKQELNRLHFVDNYPFGVLAKMAEMTESKLRAVSQGDRFLEDWELLGLIRETAKDGNTRLINLVIPNHDAEKVNGIISDEITDAVDVLSKVNISYSIKNKHAVSEAAEQLRTIADRIESEGRLL